MDGKSSSSPSALAGWKNAEVSRTSRSTADHPGTRGFHLSTLPFHMLFTILLPLLALGRCRDGRGICPLSPPLATVSCGREKETRQPDV